MSSTRTSSKHQRKSENRFQQQINSLLKNIIHPPSPLSKQWIKDREEEQKSLFQEVKKSEFNTKNQTITQLTDIGKKLQKMKKKLRIFTADDRLKTPVSENKSRKSTKSKKSQSKKGQSSHSQSRTQVKSFEQSRSKSSKKVKKSLKSSKTKNTPQFQKKTFENKLGSFSKEMQLQRDSSRPNVRILDSRIAKNSVDRGLSNSRSIGSSKKQFRNQRTESACEESSSLTDSSDTKEIINLKMNPYTSQSKYEVFIDDDKRIKEFEAGQLSREENLMQTTQLESVTKEKVLREYRILYYKNKEVKKLLTEYYEQNLRLTQEINELQQIIYEKQLENKQVKKELKFQTKDMKNMQSEYSTKIDQLGKSYQQHQMNSVPLNEFERLKQENDKILIENEMLKEDYNAINLKMQQIENEIYLKRQYEIPGQEFSQRLQRELESVKDQTDRIKEENIKLKLQLDKEYNSNRELSQQINQKKHELNGNIEQKQQELQQLQSHLQTANTKIQKLEQQLTQMKYQLITEQEQSFQIREKIIRQEEELRITNLKVENREKEINELRSKELIQKKKILDLESKIENQIYQPLSYFEPVITFNKPNNSEQCIINYKQINNKELQQERQILAKTQDQLLNIQAENDQLKRNLKQIELELQYERQQNEQIKLKFSQLQQENEFTLQRVQKQFKETENYRSKEFQITEQQFKNQENLLFSAQQRINELENEIKILNNKEQDNKNLINDQKIQIEKQQLKQEQHVVKLSELTNQVKIVEYENVNLKENNCQLKLQNQQLIKELEQIDRIKDNYKNKYLNNMYENKKLVNQYHEKENILKQTFNNELEIVKCQKEQLEKMKNQEECQRQQKDKKLKVISELQQMIKGHKIAFDK
ncbi:unnamed protein product [Paramecium primaurelia]|uniref:Uncharacterized protein n=1 Tax=Paramecium primaurelia TaxID=5886 RepID=A0A8S1KPY8_PARPR|nr:unnamed protein product [Paramecium primaurelia]